MAEVSAVPQSHNAARLPQCLSVAELSSEILGFNGRGGVAWASPAHCVIKQTDEPGSS